jgi:MipA family protein
LNGWSAAFFVSATVFAGHALAADTLLDQPVEFATASVQQGKWAFKVGAIGLTSPKYEGSNEYRVVGFPLIIPKYYGDDYDSSEKSRFTFRGLDDIRYAVIRYGNLDVGPLAGYTFGREEDDASRLVGLGDVNGGLIVGGFAAYHFDPLFVDAAFASQVTGDAGNSYTIKLGAGADIAFSERLTLSPYFSTTFASTDYMDNYFSVSQAQSASSSEGLDAFEATAGFKNVAFTLGADYRLTDRWTATGSAGYSRLLGDAADSPVTASRNQFSGNIGLTYTFGRID